jgi:hypothetical protein
MLEGTPSCSIELQVFVFTISEVSENLHRAIVSQVWDENSKRNRCPRAVLVSIGLSTVTHAIPCAPLPPASSPGFLPQLTNFLNRKCYQNENWRHDAAIRTSDGVHPYVKIWYSPQVYNWMTLNARKGRIPNGAIIVKEMYTSPTAQLSEWTVMIKDSNISWDGWYWGDLISPSPSNPNAPPKPPVDGGCAEPQVLFNGPGLYCLNCHASAGEQDTYTNTADLAPSAIAPLAFFSAVTNDMAPFTIEDTSAFGGKARARIHRASKLILRES